MSNHFLKLVRIVVRDTSIAILVLFVLRIPTYSQSPSEEFISVVEQANFIFKGTVIQWNASNIDAHIYGRSAIVRVDEVIDAVEAYRGSKKREITVLLADSNFQISSGTITFYTTGWYYGNALGVREIKNSFNTISNPNLKEDIRQARRKIYERYLSWELKSANVVVEGIVIETNLDLLPKSNLRSEHNPDIKAARIRINKIHKGEANAKTVVVYYASSMDIAWSNSPKLKKNQQGIFLLQRDQAFPILNKKEYTILDNRDVQPLSQLTTIKSLLKK